jgi:ATP-dependent Clp protease ATP-binding subunit ClpA
MSESSAEAGLVIPAAHEQARQLGSRTIGTEHMLLALLANANGRAAQALEMLAISPESVRQSVLAQRLSPGQWYHQQARSRSAVRPGRSCSTR